MRGNECVKGGRVNGGKKVEDKGREMVKSGKKGGLRLGKREWLRVGKRGGLRMVPKRERVRFREGCSVRMYV